MKARVIAGIILIFAACGGPRHARYSPFEKTTSLDPKKLYDAAEGTLLDRGFSIETRDEGAFRLVTAPRTLLGSEISKSKYRYAFIVQTAGGKLRIELRCETESATAELGSCGDEAPEKLVSEQQQIADKAIAEAGGK